LGGKAGLSSHKTEKTDSEWQAKVLEKSDSKISILFRNVPLHILSAIRRSLMEEVPTMAISAVIVLENNTVLYDEILAHRLAMIPLTSDKAIEKYKPPEECIECKDCTDCSTKLYLEVRNPDKDELVVYSGHLKSEDPDVKPALDNIPIVILDRGQSVVLEAEARLGRGREHIKWSPVSIATLVSVPCVDFDLSGAESREKVEACLSCLSNFSEALVEDLRSKGRGSIKLERFKSSSLLRYCEAQACSGIIRVRYSDREKILTFEATGALSLENALLTAIKEVKKKVEWLEGKTGSLQKTVVKQGDSSY